jgi:hypothetical protein
MNRAREIVREARAGRARAVFSVGLGLIAIAASAIGHGCTRNDSLVLLDLRSSGPLGAPVARVRLSAPGWPTRTMTGSIGPEGLRVGYYGPGSGGPVTVTATALDAVDCPLGSGSATVAKLAAGATSDPLTLFVRPTPATGCVPDAGMDASGSVDDAGADADDGGDAGSPDAGTDASDDGAGDAAADSPTDTTADATTDADIDASDASD